MKTLFAGTPEFAVPSLAALLEAGHSVVGVYTQPDRPAGRGRALRPSAVKQAAERFGVPVLQPESLRDDEAQAELAALTPDLMVVAAYGLILPSEVLELPRLGCVNVHASLLPRWRGAAPIQRAILAGDGQTGVTLMRMDAGLDTGPMLAKAVLPIGPEDNAQQVHDALAVLGGRLLAENLTALEAGSLMGEPQDDAQATYAAKLMKSEAELDWRKPAASLHRQVRAFNPWPVASSWLDGQPLRIWAARQQPGQGAPGTVVACSDAGIDVATGEGLLRITTLQRAGRKPLSAAEFLRAGDLTGRVLGRAT